MQAHIKIYYPIMAIHQSCPPLGISSPPPCDPYFYLRGFPISPFPYVVSPGGLIPSPSHGGGGAS